MSVIVAQALVMAALVLAASQGHWAQVGILIAVMGTLGVAERDA